MVVYVEPKTQSDQLWPRYVLDQQLKWGHAVACANLDADADEELVIGVRDQASETVRSGVRVYDPTDEGSGKWNRQLVEPGKSLWRILLQGIWMGWRSRHHCRRARDP